MKEIIEVESDRILPENKNVLQLQGILCSENEIPSRIMNLLEDASEIFIRESEPKGIYSDVPVSTFHDIYSGQGLNENETPLELIYPKADKLALFAVTAGKNISRMINKLFKERKFPVASMLDSIASEACEELADFIQHDYLEKIGEDSEESNTDNPRLALRYSPGYCGWHISGQRKIFDYLNPEKIRIRLLESFLMDPLKSISGIIVYGDADIHLFEDNFQFCRNCITHSCRKRMQEVREFIRDKERGKT